MAYFAALLSRDSGPWRPREVDIEGHEDTDALAHAMRLGAKGDAFALLLIEHEDEWFAVVRAEDADDPQVFVSSAAGAASSPYAAALGYDPDTAEEEEDDPAGDAELLADLGTPAEELLRLAGDDGPDVSLAVTALAEAAGFGELLDEMR